MKYQLIFSSDDLDEIKEAADLIGAEAAPKKKSAPAKGKGKTKPDDDGEEITVDDDDDADEVTLETLQEKAVALKKKGKVANVKALLKKFDVSAISDLDEDVYSKFMEGLNKIK